MYCTRADIEAQRIPADQVDTLCDDEMTGTNNPEIAGRVALAISNAQTTIDTKLATTHTVPFSPVPEQIKMIATDIAAFNLWTRRPGRDAPASITVWYKAAITLLADMANAVKSANQAAKDAATNIRVSTPDRIFTKDVLDTMFPTN